MVAQRNWLWGQGRLLEEVVSKVRCEQVGDTQVMCMCTVRELGAVKGVLQIEGPACAKAPRQQSEYRHVQRTVRKLSLVEPQVGGGER